MLNLLTTSYAVGLDYASERLKGASLVVSKGKLKVEKLFECVYSTNEGIPQAYKTLLSNEQYLVSTGIKGNEVLVRPLQLPLTKNSEIETAVSFQVEPLLPYPLENALIDYLRVGRQGQNSDLTILSIKKDHLQRHLDSLKEMDIEPEYVSCVPVSLALYSTLFEVSSQPYIVIYLDDFSQTVTLVKQGKLLTSYTITQGVQLLRDTYKNDVGSTESPLDSFDFSSIDPAKMPFLAKAVESLRLSLTKMIYAISKDVKDDTLGAILLAGEGHLLNHLADVLYSNLDMPVITPFPTASADFPTEELLRFAIPIGLGLNALKSANEAVNFRKQEFNYPHPWKRLKKVLFQYMFLCLALAFSFYLFGRTYLGYELDKAKQQYLELINATHKTYEAFEDEYATKFPRPNEDGDNVTLSINQLTAEDLVNRINYMQKDLKPPVDTFPFYPNVPRVSDVLAWLSTHPTVKGSLDEDGKLTSYIQIDNFSYTLVKRPDQKQRQEKYQVKVELEFTSTSPKWAREFHDALIAPNEIVDPKGEVKWGANKGKYRTSFYLKDRTNYTINGSNS